MERHLADSSLRPRLRGRNGRWQWPRGVPQRRAMYSLNAKSLGRSLVLPAEALLRFLSDAGDSTMFGGAHSALVEALCHPPKLRQEFWPMWRLHNVRQATFSLGVSFVPLAEAPPPLPEMSGSSSRIVSTPASWAAIFESS
jgi:hypothetical protein